MKKKLLCLQLLLLLAGIVSAKKFASIWPHTQNPHLQETFLVINSKNFTIIAADPSCDLIKEAIKRYEDRLFVQDCHKLNPNFKGKPFYSHALNHAIEKDFAGELKNLTIKFNGKCEHLPHMNMMEKYSLVIDAHHGAQIVGESVWGALRGLETFSQMVVNSGLNEFIINTGKLEDWPRFSHRGFLVDTARHFQPLHLLLQTLDAMEMNKLNVFHWHIVDDQAFPFESTTFPDLSKKRSLQPNNGLLKADVDHLLEYARLRGIRVLVEFDSPGHTQSWGPGEPSGSLLTRCFDKEGKEHGHGPIDPTVESNYDFIKKLFTEVSHRFPDQYLHLGGDEVSFDCWKSNPNITAFMTAHRMAGNYSQLESLYIQKVLDIVSGLRKSYIVWQEVLDNKAALKPDTVVHVWIQDTWQKEIARATASGYRTLLSAPWYLDWVSWGQDWVRYYETDPLGFNGTEAQKALVLGGEACLWAEYVDGSNLISKSWPRASAIAERLWSSSTHKKASEARGRFHGQFCRMQRLGIRGGPIDGPGFCLCDGAL
ncbi:hypothetical protein TYRP_019842 [Tyrophagus putrescentiae]|nr:hypothetical protein TYRP_019842 [Tyrophagus putrescentiae]